MFGLSEVFLATKFGRKVAMVAAAVAAFFVAIALARRDGRRAAEAEHHLDELEDYRDANDRINRADVGGGDAAGDLEWLRRRAERGRGAGDA